MLLLTAQLILKKILEKIALANCINDTADVEFYKVKHLPLQSLEILTPIFVDNIILFGITTEARINRKSKTMSRCWSLQLQNKGATNRD